MSNTKITVETEVSAPVSKVWENWTGPEHIKQWCSASDDWHVPSATNDLKTGGEFHTRMEAKDGSFGFDFGGIYDEVKSNERIAYTMGDGRQVEVTFEKLGDQTKIVEVFDAEQQNSIDMQRGGWQSILDNFKRYTEAN
ncbi:MAG: Activator of Hsp90 ATPase 1 family protein [Bacteroidetes bacterium]|nr:Activator of Hsp90 ATPase 1 family protein [Bacteroidota bacterium]